MFVARLLAGVWGGHPSAVRQPSAGAHELARNAMEGLRVIVSYNLPPYRKPAALYLCGFPHISFFPAMTLFQ